MILVGQILHELLHALGVMHEIMRPDRDQYIILHEENIDKSYLEEFKKIREHQSILTDQTLKNMNNTLKKGQINYAEAPIM
ncbi:unnamed protein product [Schistosoma margrebowiei]|uniref:Metalloendopeptidase n=1 Tax=Schistosoma margrebowiei TaxID=48269 RepID=A0A183M0D7_9TREM|nr:unnamed protein product [Schistosoma margrebowiei]